MSRPEFIAPPEVFYNNVEARKYTFNSRMLNIQTEMTERALELLNLPEDQVSLILDVGCGSGLSGETVADAGHIWVGFDISKDMLEVAQDRDTDGDLALADAGQGAFYRPGVFDGVISISAIQWLCNADKKHHRPERRMQRFFTTLYTSLKRGARAVLQFYPSDATQVERLTAAAMKAGFTGGVVVDYPNSSKRKKFYMCLFAGTADAQVPAGLRDDGTPQTVDAGDITFRRGAHRRIRSSDRPTKGSREWIMAKKELYRRRGVEVVNDSKYSGRRRRRL
ncbi:methyltransferase [Fonticula alba]|uniref:Methyltransferase n=1 Tax=Fonticula alba TaxID=691883 RepID=A0A058Z854_FONAL|nr:methyltransferase [Fonticula alba]KCV70301.1 methyltransferase [Fonticula alba]|eukprot:XP_009494817.1 methyltransferase [Fonticula alba]